jgi:hypothetical protein
MISTGLRDRSGKTKFSDNAHEGVGRDSQKRRRENRAAGIADDEHVAQTAAGYEAFSRQGSAVRERYSTAQKSGPLHSPETRAIIVLVAFENGICPGYTSCGGGVEMSAELQS